MTENPVKSNGGTPSNLIENRSTMMPFRSSMTGFPSSVVQFRSTMIRLASTIEPNRQSMNRFRSSLMPFRSTERVRAARINLHRNGAVWFPRPMLSRSRPQMQRIAQRLVVREQRHDFESTALEVALLEGIRSPHRPYRPSTLDRIRKAARILR